jgi:hypothetical protein
MNAATSITATLDITAMDNASNASIAATPAKLRSGAWGARVAGRASEGDLLTITTRAGKSWQATVAKVVWRGSGVTLCATEQATTRRGPGSAGYVPSGLVAAVGASAARQSVRYERAGGGSRRTGCSCGSREDSHGELIPSSRNCFTCNHDA